MRRLYRILLTILVCLTPLTLAAHEAGLSELKVCADATGYRITWEIGAADAALIRSTPKLLVGAENLPASAVASTRDRGVMIQWRLPANNADDTVTLSGIDALRFGHRVIVRVCRSSEAVEVLSAAAARFVPSALPSQPQWVALREGFTHILGGLDHLLFLLVLVVAANRFRTVVVEVTLFAIAHSLMLLASARWSLLPPSEIVEPAIALSIVLAALVNLTQISVGWRRMLVTATGLLHGLGFGGYLAEWTGGAGLDLNQAFQFNLGVELGQLLVVGVAFAIILQFQSRGHARRLRLWGTAAAASVGSVWFLERILG